MFAPRYLPPCLPRVRVRPYVLGTLVSAAIVAVALGQPHRGLAGDGPGDAYRWNGHDFAFCFVSDDGRGHNLGWAAQALVDDFRFTIAINAGNHYWGMLTREQLHALAQQGFEIANHAHTHGHAGLPQDCPAPPRGSLAGYFQCAVDPDSAQVYFTAEIERDSVSVYGDLAQPITTLAYPMHMYNHAIIDALIAEGYLGARSGGTGSTTYWSNGEFSEWPRNGWEEGISLFRIPVAAYSAELFGDHSAEPPVHFTREQFVAAAAPVIAAAREAGGILTVYAHHFGDDDDSYGDVNYGAGGITPQELGWLVAAVRAQNGIVMTLGEAVAYFRARTICHQSYEGDFIWAPAPIATPVPRDPPLALSPAVPNPCRPRTTVFLAVAAARPITVTVHDLTGRCVARLADRVFAPGSHRLQWDARDQDGRLVPAGIYLVTAVGGEDAATRKVVLLR